MCIIAYQPAGKIRLNRSELHTCYENNPDGMGIMYPKEGKVKVWKTLKDFRGLYNRYTTARDLGLPIVLHFRIGNKGAHSLDNCHPFWVREGDLALMHNGTLDIETTRDGPSDTKIFAERILPKLPANFLHDDDLFRIVARFVGYNKVVLMNGEGAVTIFNESGGDWYDLIYESGEKSGSRVWYSNTSFRRSTFRQHGWQSSYWCSSCHKSGPHETEDCPDKPKGKMWCTYCGSWQDHIWGGCPVRKGKGITKCGICHATDHKTADCPYERYKEALKDYDPDEDAEDLDTDEELDADERDHIRFDDGVIDTGITYQGKPFCWDCIPDAVKGSSLIIPIKVPDNWLDELYCDSCGVVLYEPSWLAGEDVH